MTWNIRIYPLEREAMLKALATHDFVGTDAEREQAVVAIDLMDEILDAIDAEDTGGQLYDCSLVGHLSEDAASLSINVYRRRAETQPQQPQPAESEEAEVTPAAAESPPEEVAAEE